jgi:hypothetical protein
MEKYLKLINNNDLSNSDLLDKINNDNSITECDKNDLKLIIAKKSIDLLYKYKSFDISLIGDQILVDLLKNEPGLTEILSIKNDNLIKEYEIKYTDLIFKKINFKGILSLDSFEKSFLKNISN